jgi:hypothetical protein
MKKLLGLLLVLGLGILLVSGCEQPLPSIPESTAADGIGEISKLSVAIDNAIVDDVLSVLSATSIRAFRPSTPEVGSDDWWHSSDSYTAGDKTHTRDFYFKIWDENGVLITTKNLLKNISFSNIGKLYSSTSWAVSSANSSYTVKLGTSKSDPLIFDGYNNTETLSGPVIYESSFNDQSFVINLTYGNLTVSPSGYPSGTVGVRVTADSKTLYEATLLFDGSAIAELTFTLGGTGSYLINIYNGEVTPIT